MSSGKKYQLEISSDFIHVASHSCSRTPLWSSCAHGELSIHSLFHSHPALGCRYLGMQIEACKSMQHLIGAHTRDANPSFLGSVIGGGEMSRHLNGEFPDAPNRTKKLKKWVIFWRSTSCSIFDEASGCLKVLLSLIRSPCPNSHNRLLSRIWHDQTINVRP